MNKVNFRMRIHMKHAHNSPVHPTTAPPRLVHTTPTLSIEGNTVLVITAISTALNALHDEHNSTHRIT